MKTEPNQTRKEFGEGLRYHPHNGVLKARWEFKRPVWSWTYETVWRGRNYVSKNHFQVIFLWNDDKKWAALANYQTITKRCVSRNYWFDNLGSRTWSAKKMMYKKITTILDRVSVIVQITLILNWCICTLLLWNWSLTRISMRITSWAMNITS